MTEEDMKTIGLSQVAAAALLGKSPNTIWRQIRGRLPISGDLQYLVASWSVMTDEQRAEVRRRLAEMRR